MVQIDKQRLRQELEQQLRQFKDKSNAPLLIISDINTSTPTVDLLLNDTKVQILLKRKGVIPIVVVPMDSDLVQEEKEEMLRENREGVTHSFF